MDFFNRKTGSIFAVLGLIFTLTITNMNSSFSSPEEQKQAIFVQIPGGYTLNKTIHNPAEFERLSSSKVSYQIITRGQLVTFSRTLDFVSAKNILQPGGSWIKLKNGQLAGPADCKSLAIGVDTCSKILNLETGESLVSPEAIESLDTHEITIDKDGNFWVLSYPITICSKEITEKCKKYNVEENKMFVDCQINKIDSSGRLLFTWRASENIAATSPLVKYRKELNRGNYVDVFHCNSIDIDSNKGILLSLRNLNSIYYIDFDTSQVLWKLGGRYESGISLLAKNFKDKVGSESIAQHDARSLGNGFFSYFDNNSHYSKPARGVIFKVTKVSGKSQANMVTEFVNPNGNNSMCTGSMRKSDLGNYILGWGCNLDLMTLFSNDGKPIVTLSVIKTPQTMSLFQNQPVIFNGVDWGPAFDYGITYRVLPVF